MKMLAINKSPLIDCYDFESFPYNIVSLNDTYSGWIASNYLGLVMQKDFINKPIPFGFYLPNYRFIPGVETMLLNRELLNNTISSDIITFIKYNLEKEYYIYLNINEFYIPNREAFNKFDNSHDVLVHGIDNDKEIIFVYGYSKNRKLETIEISYDDFSKAYRSLNEKNNYCTQIELFKVFDSTFNFTTKYIKYMINAFLNSEKLNFHFNTVFKEEELVYGVECFDYLIKYYKCTFYEKELKGFHKFKIPHKLVEYERVVDYLVNYLFNNSYVKKNFSEKSSKILKKSIILENQTIKFSLSNTQNDLIKCLNIINDIKQDQITLFEELLIYL